MSKNREIIPKKYVTYKNIKKLRIVSCLACVYRFMDARGKFGEHRKVEIISY